MNESLGGIAPALTGRRTSLTAAALLLGVVFSGAGASVPLQRTDMGVPRGHHSLSKRPLLGLVGTK